jgi:hypothetical protein
VTDAALGFRYVVAPGEVDRFDTRLVRSWPGTRLYENTLALPAGFFVEPSARKPLPKDPFAAQEQLIGAPGLFTPLCVPKPEATNAELTLKGGTLVARRGIDGGSMTLRWTCRAKGRQQAYAWTRVPMPWSMETVTWDGKQAEYPSIPDNGILGLGSFEDRTFDVTLTSRRKQLRLPVAFVRGLDVSRLERRVSELRANAMTDVTWSGRGLSGRVAKADGGLLFLSVPKVPGWRVQVDGKTVRPRRLAGSFLGLDLGPGEHRITLSYWPPAFNAGIGGTAAGLVLLGLLVFLDRRRSRVDAGVAVPEQLPEPRERDLAGAM